MQAARPVWDSPVAAGPSQYPHMQLAAESRAQIAGQRLLVRAERCL